MFLVILLLVAHAPISVCFVNHASVATKRSNVVRMTGEIDASIIPKNDKKLKFGLGSIAFSLLPLSPESVGRRKTLMTEIIKDKIYTLDQVQGIINVNVPVRCTIINLKDGLFINNPVAPTEECIQMVRDLSKRLNKEVKYIVLSSLGIEHKGTSGIFSSYFPKAKVFVQPGSYSFPINLPNILFYRFMTDIRDIPEKASDAPWSDEIDHLILGPLKPKGAGGFAETAFFHKSTGTLLVTDVVVKVLDEIPAIIDEDPRALLYHARDDMTEVVKDTRENRLKGWRRMVLFALTFQPSGIEVLDTFDAIKMVDSVPESMKFLGNGAIPYDGRLYPWRWIKDERPNFAALQGGLLVAPILQKLILNREPQKVLNWVDSVCKWPIKRIIPCHLANDIVASSKDFRDAFSFLEEEEQESSFISSLFGRSRAKLPRPNEDDCKLLSDASVLLTKNNVLFEEGERVRRRK